MQFIDLITQQKKIRSDLEHRIKTVLDHGKFIMGPEVGELEAKLAEFVGVKHCVGVSSGTDALLIAMMALGIKAGDEVITTPFTFISTGEMIAMLGAIPVFVDIDPQTYTIAPENLEAAITPNTKAILPVSLFGQCADFDAINSIADKHQLPVIEDAAQSLGATYKGRQSCALSSLGCTSFFPSKPLGAYGDAGACFTDDDTLAEAMREIRVHGQDRRYNHPRIGINGRLDTLQAAVLLSKLNLFPEEVEARSRIGQRYSDRLSNNRTKKVLTPFIAPYNTSVYAQYTILVDEREKIQQCLNRSGIPTAIHYPIPLHLQPAFKSLGLSAGDLPIAEATAKRVISLPIHPYLEPQQQDRVVEQVVSAIDS